jgi:CubicO group peptidase (beta-lactamase class C family)
VNRVEEIVARTQQRGCSPAVIAAVMRDGAVAHVASAGEAHVPSRDTQFRIGSITKSLTAAVLVGLRDSGRLDLDDRIGRHVADLAPPIGALRLRQLLGHVAGLQREPDGVWWERSVGVSGQQLHAGVTAEKLAFRPYLTFHYSNLAYGLLGSVITAVTGQTWYEAVRERILDPLDMRRTTYEPLEPYARGYVVHPFTNTTREEPRLDAQAMAAAGQLWSTVDDMARWATVLACSASSGGRGAVGPTVLSPESVAEMAAPVTVSDPDSWEAGYGLGLHLRRQGNRVYCGHTGSMPGYLAVLWVHRASRTGAVVFANSYTLRGTTIADVGAAVIDAVLDTEPAGVTAPWRPSTAPPPEIARLCGVWWWMGRRFELRWDASTRLLVLDGDHDCSWFRQVAPERFIGVAGREKGETLIVLHDEEDRSGVPASTDAGAPDVAPERVTGLEIATFRYRTEP